MSSSHLWLAHVIGKIVGPLRSARVARLHRYYEPVRPLGTLWYSVLVGQPLGALPSHRDEGSHVPQKSLRKAHAAFVPDPALAVDRLPQSFIPGQRTEPGFEDIASLSTGHQRFTLVRLPCAHLTGLPAFSGLAHHPAPWGRAAAGGLGPDPAIRTRGADPHLLCSKAASRRPQGPPFRAVVAHVRLRTGVCP